MTNYFKSNSRPFTLYFLAFIIFFFPVAVSAGITVFDSVGPFDKTIKLKALTKGRFFPEGGRLVKFYVNDKYIGSTLSGGDGYAFMKYKASSAGIKTLNVEAGKDTNGGLLLLTGNEDKILLVEIEGILFQSIMSIKPSNKSREALQWLSKKFRIIYLIRIIGLQKSREWLKEHKLPLSVVLKWTGKDLIRDLQERGAEPYAIIAPSDMLVEATDIKNRFSFEDTEDGESVKDWDHLIKQLE